MTRTREPIRSTGAIALSALVLAWIVLGPQMLTSILGDATLAWGIYAVALALLVGLVLLARRAQRAAERRERTDAASARVDK